MKFYKILSLVLAGAVALASCKKDDSEETLNYFNIYPGLDHPLPKYVSPGETYTFVIYGAQRDTNDTSTKSIGYVMSCTGQPNDTVRFEGGSEVRPYTVVIPDSLCTFNVSGQAYAEGYYGGTTSTSATVVKGGLDGEGSITGFKIPDGAPSFTDPRDNKVYFYTEINGVKWLRNNLAYSGSGIPYCSCACMDDVFGRFYNWNDALTACPKGWELPSSADFDNALAGYDNVGAFIADLYFNGKAMWEYWPEVKISDSSLLSMMPVGYGVYGTVGTTFYDLGSRAVLWTADASGNDGVARYIYKDKNVLYSGIQSSTDFFAPVRCIKK